MLENLNCRQFSLASVEKDKEEWLKERRKGIGGSDIGAICGVNNYSSPRAIYMQKTGQYSEALEPNDAAKERMKFGILLESVVANEYAERTGDEIAKVDAMLVHEKYDWALANVDRLIIKDGKPVGVLECKTAGEFSKDMWETGEIPPSYLYQLQWYLFVTGLQEGAIACLVGGNKFYHYKVFRDEMLIKKMVEAGQDFWYNNVLILQEPEVMHNDTSLVNKYEGKEDTELLLEGDAFNDLANTVVECKARIKELEKIQKTAENKIKDVMKDNVFAYTRDHVIKWTPVNSQRVDTKTLKTEYPDVYAQVLYENNYRRFTIKC